MVYLNGLGQSSPHELAFGVELGSRGISLHGIKARVGQSPTLVTLVGGWISGLPIWTWTILS